jgi:hypothetical protein
MLYSATHHPAKTLHSSRPAGRSFIPPMFECAWSYGNSKLGSGCQQYSNNRSSMICGSHLGSICYIHELRMRSGSREFQEYISAHCLLCSNQLSSIYLFLVDKSNMVNDFVCLNRCGLWSPRSSPYSLQVLGQSYYFQTRVIS